MKLLAIGAAVSILLLLSKRPKLEIAGVVLLIIVGTIFSQIT